MDPVVYGLIKLSWPVGCQEQDSFIMLERAEENYRGWSDLPAGHLGTYRIQLHCSQDHHLLSFDIKTSVSSNSMIKFHCWPWSKMRLKAIRQLGMPWGGGAMNLEESSWL